VIAGGAAAVAAVALAFFLFATEAGKNLMGGGGEAAPKTLTRTVFVQSAESGATIWKDGEDTGLVVPAEIQLEGAEGDAVLLELKRDDRVVASRRMVVDPAMPTEWVATEAAVPAQSFAVVTRPAGAKVFLNDDLVAETTPADVQLVAGERYNLRVELPEHHPKTLEFAFPADLDKSTTESGRFSFNLEPVIPPGHLVVAASYPVKIAVGGKSYGPDAKHDISLKPGAYDVEITSDDVFLSTRQKVEVSANGRAELEVPPAVKFRVAAQPGNCKVHINGRLVDEVPFDQYLVPGRYEFRFEWPALQQSRTITEEITASTTQVFGTPETR
jgi:hypothetical protein